jgi:DNA-binding response OmpR family regulator
MRLILAEDDAILGNAMQKALTRSAFAVDWVRTGREFRQAISVGSYEFALLDLSLPDDAGEALLRRVREKPPHLPVIVVTGRRDAQAKVNLLDMGADDYVTKPFDLNELVARVRSVLRRTASSDAKADADAFSYGALRLFPQRHAASWYGIPVELTRHEFCVLDALARRKGQVLTRSQLEESVYCWGQEIASNAIEVYVHRLRRKFSPDLIETVRGVGYQLTRIDVDA